MNQYPSFSKLNVLLAKIQESLGTKQAALVADDFVTVGEDFSLDFKEDFKEQGLAQGIFGQPRRIRGVQTIDVKVSMPVIPVPSDYPVVEPNIGDFLKCAGHKYELVEPYLNRYTPSSDIDANWKDMTLWGYTGNKSNGKTIITKVHSVMFDCKLAWTIGEAMMAEFTGKGVPDGIPAPGNYVSGTLPLLSVVPPAFLKTTNLLVLGSDYSVLKGELAFGNQIELIKNPADETGFLRATIKSRIATFSMTVYQNAGETDPIADMDGEVVDDMLLTFGASTAEIEIASSSAAFHDVKSGKDGDLNTHEISGYFVNNDYMLNFGNSTYNH
jgi:hypothetical protein